MPDRNPRGKTRSTGLIQRLKRQAESLKTDAYVLYLAWRHPRTPWYARLLLIGVLAYVLSPVELIPDFIPVIGLVDDVVIVRLGTALAIRLIPPAVMAECRDRAQVAPDPGTPASTCCLVLVAAVATGCLLASFGVLIAAGLIVLLVVYS